MPYKTIRWSSIHQDIHCNLLVSCIFYNRILNIVGIHLFVSGRCRNHFCIECSCDFLLRISSSLHYHINHILSPFCSISTQYRGSYWQDRWDSFPWHHKFDTHSADNSDKNYHPQIQQYKTPHDKSCNSKAMNTPYNYQHKPSSKSTHPDFYSDSIPAYTHCNYHHSSNSSNATTHISSISLLCNSGSIPIDRMNMQIYRIFCSSHQNKRYMFSMLIGNSCQNIGRSYPRNHKLCSSQRLTICTQKRKRSSRTRWWV